MSWSMDSVSYRMSGSGSWQNLLPDKQAQKMYAGIYPAGLPSVQTDGQLHRYLELWKRAHIIRLDSQKALPTGPIMTDSDMEILHDWFGIISDGMSRAVLDKIHEYRRIALDLAGRRSSERKYVDNILTIIICALTLDSGVFSLLRKEMMGTYPDRDFAGTFFFWGYGFSRGPSRIFGFTTYGPWQWPRLHVLRSHRLDREVIKSVFRRSNIFEFINRLTLEEKISDYAYSSETDMIVTELRQAGILEGDDPPHLGIPVFFHQGMAEADLLFHRVSEKIKQQFLDLRNDLDDLVRRCSFRQCTRADIYCMLFHLAYSYAADKLVENGTIPDFPAGAGGEWGVWIY